MDAALVLFRTLIDQSSDGIEVSDPETGRLLDINRTTCERHGYTREEMLTLSVADLESNALNAHTWPQMVDEIRRSGFKIIVGRHKRKDGSTFPMEVNVRCVTVDREYVVASVRDITERKRAEEEIQSQLEELRRWQESVIGREERIMELKQEVNELLAQLKQPARYFNPDNA
jgi:PAS domain S-box-containing protein